MLKAPKSMSRYLEYAEKIVPLTEWLAQVKNSTEQLSN